MYFTRTLLLSVAQGLDILSHHQHSVLQQLMSRTGGNANELFAESQILESGDLLKFGGRHLVELLVHLIGRQQETIVVSAATHVPLFPEVKLHLDLPVGGSHAVRQGRNILLHHRVADRGELLVEFDILGCGRDDG